MSKPGNVVIINSPQKEAELSKDENFVSYQGSKKNSYLNTAEKYIEKTQTDLRWEYTGFSFLGIALIIFCFYTIKRNYKSLRESEQDWLSVSKQSSVMYAIIGLVFGTGIFLHQVYSLIKSLIGTTFH